MSKIFTKERGITLSDSMVMAILDERKTMTRRLNKRWLTVKKGDRLWVREAWKPHVQTSVHSPAIYRADYPLVRWPGPWKSSRFMPRWASRITLEATADARLERLQEISGKDAIEEGCGKGVFEAELLHYGGYKKAREEFRFLWDSLNSKKASWKDNPEVVVLQFRRI